MFAFYGKSLTKDGLKGNQLWQSIEAVSQKKVV